MENLKVPLDYEYKLIQKNQDVMIFRIKGIINEDSFQEWLEKVELISNSIWHLDRTYKRDVLNLEYSCQPKSQDPSISKITHCPARLTITIQRCNSSLTGEFPALCVWHFLHNHPLVDKEATSQHRLRNEICMKSSQLELSKKQSKSPASGSTEAVKPLPSPSPCTQQMSELPACDATNTDILETMSSSLFLSISEEDKFYFKNIKAFMGRLELGVKNNPSAFKPALMKMFQNIMQFAKTETQLVTALHNFARPCNEHLWDEKRSQTHQMVLLQNESPTSQEKISQTHQVVLLQNESPTSQEKISQTHQLVLLQDESPTSPKRYSDPTSISIDSKRKCVQSLVPPSLCAKKTYICFEKHK